MKKREPVKKTGLFRPFLLLLSTVSSDFHPDDPALLWGVISLRDRQLLRRPDIWTLAILAAPLLPSPTALPVCFCDTAPLHGIFSQGCLETPGTQSSFPAFQPSPQQRAWRPPPCPSPFQALSTESSGISGAHLGRCASSSHAPTYDAVFAATVIMPVLIALHGFKQRPPCWGIPNWLLTQS